MTADMTQRERNNIKCYTSTFSTIQNIDYTYFHTLFHL